MPVGAQERDSRNMATAFLILEALPSGALDEAVKALRSISERYKVSAPVPSAPAHGLTVPEKGHDGKPGRHRG